MRERSAWLVAMALVVGLVAAACGGGSGSSSESSEGGTVSIAGEKANDHGEESVSGESEFKLEADDFYFEPTVLKGDPGQKVKLEIDNEGSATHNFSIDEQGINEDINSGDDATVTVTLPQSGSLVFYCKFHRSQGMLGELSVS